MAFAGRSNVGKSSLINALVKQHGLARTSNTPGRTQELNFFETPGVALYPGRHAGLRLRRGAEGEGRGLDASWCSDYLRGRATLLRVFLLIDARHGLKSADRAMMALLDEAAVSYQAVLTKADKIKPPRLAEAVVALQSELATHAAAYGRVLATSSQTGSGVDAVRAEIAALAAAHGAAAT